MRINKGDKFPDLTVSTGFRSNLTVKELADKKTVLWVIRYIGCTVCRYDVHLLEQKYEEIKNKGYNLFVVMQSDQKHIQDEFKEHALPFEIICDPTLAFYKELEINPALNTEELCGDNPEVLSLKSQNAKAAGFKHGDYEGDELQLPALFIIDEELNVLHAHYGKSIVDMPTPDELVEML